MHQRRHRGLIAVGLGLLLGGVSLAQPIHQPWLDEAAGHRLLENVRGSVSFFYRSNELMGSDGYSLFGPQFHLDGSLMGDRVFYSANVAYKQRERFAGSDDEVPGAAVESQLLGAARLGFRLGRSSLFEVEYSNDRLSSFGRDSILFLSGQQQSSLGGIERGKSSYLAVRNVTRLGSVAQLTTSLAYTDHSSALQLSSAAQGPLPDLSPDYLRRLEIREHARGRFWLLGVHQLETGVRFLLDQIGIRSSSGDLEGKLYDEKQFRASSVGLFLQDRWQLMRGWNMHMGVAYELPGAAEVRERSEWTLGLHRNAAPTALQFGANTFVRNGFPQLADFGRSSASVELAARADSTYRDALGLGGSSAANYGGIKLFLGKTLARTFDFFLSYTFSHLWGAGTANDSDVVFGTVESDVPSIADARTEPGSGSLDPAWKRTHLLHFNASYRLSPTLQLGSTVNYLYADPLEFVTAEATLVNPGADHNVSVDVHLQKILRLGDSEVGLMLDVFNLLDVGSLVPYDTAYDIDLALLEGRRVQLGMRYGF